MNTHNTLSQECMILSSYFSERERERERERETVPMLYCDANHRAIN